MRLSPFFQWMRLLSAVVVTITVSASEKLVAPTFMRPEPEVLRRWNQEHRALPAAVHLHDSNRERGSKVQLLSHLQGAIEDRNQGASANAWVWASTAMVEVALSTGYGWKDRLSIQYMHAQLGGIADFHLLTRTGSTLPGFAALLNQNRILIPWSNAQAGYVDGKINAASTHTLVEPNSLSLQPQYRIRQITAFSLPTGGRSQAEMVALIRTALAEGQAVGFSFKTHEADFRRFWTEGKEDNLWVNAHEGGTWDDAWGAHMVVLVGYDCGDADPSKHSWIALNSWGSNTGRPGGLFRIPMRMNYNAAFRLGDDPAELDCYQFQVIRLEMETPVTEPLCVEATLSDPNPVVGQPLSFTSSVQGVPPVAYQWRRNGETIPGASSAVHAIPYLTPMDGGAAYDVQVTSGTSRAFSTPLTFSVQGTQALVNPGFEDEGGWIWAPTPGRCLVPDAHSGAMAALVGGAGAVRVSQKVSLPTDAKNAWISWWTRYAVDGTGDRLSVQVCDESGMLLETLWSRGKDSQQLLWTHDWASLDAYLGRTIYVVAEASGDGKAGAGFELDDFALVLDAPQPTARRLSAQATAPTIASFSPTSGGIGTIVYITGTGFTGATQVLFNGVAGTTVTVVNDTALNVKVPKDITSGLITVIAPGGSVVSKDAFTSTRMVIHSFGPGSGIIGSKITVQGENFHSLGEVYLNETLATFTLDSDKQLTVVVPANARSGPIKVWRTSDRSQAVSKTSFMVEADAAPVLSSFTPSEGGSGTYITLKGEGFSGAGQVDFSGIPANFSTTTDKEILVSVPPSARTGPISVTTSKGKGASSSSFKVTSPIINSFTPDKGGIGTQVVLTGSNFKNASVVKFYVSKASFVVDSDTQITATVPVATSGPITVEGPNGYGMSLTEFRIEAPGAPTVTSFSPMEGKGGTKVDLIGTGFSNASEVKFNGTGAAFTIASDTRITAEAPLEVTTGPITVITPMGQGQSTLSFKSTRMTLTAISPRSGPIGSKVTLTGSGFTAVTQANLSGEPASFKIDSDTQITLVVPPTSSGTLWIHSLSDSVGSPFEIAPMGPPTITRFNPAEGGDHAEVLLEGTNFSGTLSVKFNGEEAFNWKLSSDTKILTRAPRGVSSGPITLTNPLGTATSPGIFKGKNPLITSFTPRSAPIGTKVVLTGQNLTGTRSVTFNSVISSFTVDSDTQITATVPRTSDGYIGLDTPFGSCQSMDTFTVAAGVAPTISSFSPEEGGTYHAVAILGTGFSGANAVSFNGVNVWFEVESDTRITTSVPDGATTGKLRVTTPLGMAESATDFRVRTPIISGIAPDSGPIGTKVIITGKNLTNASVVFFGHASVAAFTVNSDTQITATAPSSGGYIRVTTPWGDAKSANAFTVLAGAAPVITGFSPSQGNDGGLIRLTGSGFSGTSAVQFNGVSADFTLISDTELTTYVPSGATTGPISLTTGGGTAVSSMSFQATNCRLTGFSPPSGPIGTHVRLFGSNLTGTTGVVLFGVKATFTVVSDTELAVVVPPTTSGLFFITGARGAAYSSTKFNVMADQAPAIVSFSPTEGSAGSMVTILGKGFSGATSVTLNGVHCPISMVSDTTLQTSVPWGAKNGGVIAVATPRGTAVSASSFVIIPPTVLKLEPSAGVVGTRVLIQGKGLNSVSSVTFNGVSATWTLLSDSQIETTVPAGATTGQVLARDGQGAGIGSAFTVLAPTSPMVNSFSPTSGPEGTPVTVFGMGLSAATEVRFHDTPARFNIQSDTALICYVPAFASSGTLTIVHASGMVQSQALFTVTGLSISPLQSATMTGATLVFSALSQGAVDPLIWKASGGSPLAGAGSSFTWTAPQTPGEVVVTVSSGSLTGSRTVKVKGRDLGTGLTNAATLSVFSFSYGRRLGESGFVEAADLNGDGIINDQDITLWFAGR